MRTGSILVCVLVLLYCCEARHHRARGQQRRNQRKNAQKRNTGQKNVLLIISDDLRADIKALHDLDPATAAASGYYTNILTPNLDALIADPATTNFERAYCQQSVCGPSRASFLTSRRPNTIDVHANADYFRDTDNGQHASLTQIFQHFRDNTNTPYETYGLGKLFHTGTQENKEKRKSFSRINQELKYKDPQQSKGHWGSASWSAIPADDYDCSEADQSDCLLLPDMELTEQAIEWLNEAKDRTSPFLMAVGYGKPHLPFVFPEEFLASYSQVSPPANYKYPNNTSQTAADSYGELRGYNDVPAAGLTGDFAEIETAVNAGSGDVYDKIMDLRTAYFATVSHIDDEVGKLLDHLDTTSDSDGTLLADNTVVLFTSDHGWHLMENSLLGKRTNFEIANRVPFILRVPGETGGTRTDVVELVDLFPTLAAAAGIEVPESCANAADSDFCTDGVDLLSAEHKTHAYSQFPRTHCERVNGVRTCEDLVGYSSKSTTARYTAWTYDDNGEHKIRLREYYDHISDPGEQQNLAVDPISAGAVCSDIMVHEAAMETNLNLSLRDKLTC